ncbi:MAG: large subunit ribosomal protein L19 [Planctomycetota bacterium]
MGSFTILITWPIWLYFRIMTHVLEKFAPKEMIARKNLDIRSGDTVKVHVKIVEKGKTRIQIFHGLVLAVKHGREAGATFTVRKMSGGVGVERIFPIYSPNLAKIEVVKRSRVRRSKLYYIRTKVARQVRRKMRNFISFFASTDDLVIPADEMMEEVLEDETPVIEVSETETATEDTPEDPQEEVAEVAESAPETENTETKEEESTPEETGELAADSEEPTEEEKKEEA